MKKEQVDLENAVVWIPDSKTPNGIAEVPLTDLAVEAFRDQIRISGPGPWLFPSDENPSGHQKTLKTVWHATLRRAKVPYFRIYDLRSTYATRLSAGGVADEWVTQLLTARRCQGLQEVLADETADEEGGSAETEPEGQRKRRRVLSRRRSTDGVLSRFCHGRSDSGPIWADGKYRKFWKWFRIKRSITCRGVAQPGSAPALGAGGRVFKSHRPDQTSLNQRRG